MTRDNKTRYMMLSRLKQDCEYYLGHGSRNPKNLWAGSEARQIEFMEALWNSFGPDEKPEWLTPEQIRAYGERMLTPDKYRGVTDKCCEILERTRDGDYLDPADLKLTELAVNRRLNDKGLEALDKLHRRVMAGEYVKPWLHGVEHMTRDNEGFIFYKDKQVEHYSGFYINSLEAGRDLANVAERCAYLERQGVEVSCANVIWGWDRHKDAFGAEQKEKLDLALAGSGVTFSKIAIDNNWNREIQFFSPGIAMWEQISAGPEFRDLYNNCDNTHGFEVSIQSYRYGGAADYDGPEAMSLIPFCYDYLREQKVLDKVKSQNFMVPPERSQETEYQAEDEDEAEDSL